MKYFVIWLALFLAFAVGLGSLNLPTYYKIATHGVSGKASVVELLPNIHNTVRYKYHAAGQVLQAQHQPWQPNPPLERLNVGDQLVIYYLPDRPEESVLGDPRPILKNEIVSVGLAAVIFPTFLVLIGKIQISRRRRQKNRQDA